MKPFEIAQAVVGLIVLGVWAYMLLTGREVPTELSALAGLIVGYFFRGVQDTVVKLSRKFIRSALARLS